MGSSSKQKEADARAFYTCVSLLLFIATAHCLQLHCYFTFSCFGHFQHMLAYFGTHNGPVCKS